MRLRLCTLVGVLCAVAVLALPSAASAHLKFSSFQPATKPLKTAPKQAVLTFTGNIGDGLKEVSLISPSGKTTRLTPTISGKQARIALPSSMASGTWTVEWAATGPDGHPQRDSRSFSIQKTTKPVSSAPSFPTSQWSAVSFIGRFLFFGSLLLFVGGGVFASVAAQGFLPSRWGAMAVGTAAGATLVLAAHNAVADRRSLTGLLDPRGWLGAITDAGGRGYAVSAVAVIIAFSIGRRELAPAEWRRRGGALPWTLLAALSAAVIGPTLSSHATSSDLQVLRIPLDVLHVAAAAIWLGGLVQLLALTIPRRARNPAIVSALHRYSQVALGSIITVVATGVIAALIEIDANLTHLVSDPYGRLVLAKMLLLAIAMPLARANQKRHIPQIRRDGPTALAPLRRYVAWEVAIAMWIVLATAALVHEAPPRGNAASTHPTKHSSH